MPANRSEWLYLGCSGAAEVLSPLPSSPPKDVIRRRQVANSTFWCRLLGRFKNWALAGNEAITDLGTLRNECVGQCDGRELPAGQDARSIGRPLLPGLSRECSNRSLLVY